MTAVTPALSSTGAGAGSTGAGGGTGAGLGLTVTGGPGWTVGGGGDESRTVTPAAVVPVAAWFRSPRPAGDSVLTDDVVPVFRSGTVDLGGGGLTATDSGPVGVPDTAGVMGGAESAGAMLSASSSAAGCSHCVTATVPSAPIT